MAQTKKKRKRKHRGTQGGRVDSTRRARPRTREEAKARAKSRGSSPKARGDKPPSWRSAAIRGGIAAVLFVVLLFLIFKETIGQSIIFGVFMLAFYIPAGYYIDQWTWRRRERERMRGRTGGR